MSHLKRFIYQMTNPELIGLAKNRFLDTEDQVAIAGHHYRRAHTYLVANPNLQEPAKEILWNYKGYARKCDLLQYGHYLNNPLKYKELYDKHGAHIRSPSNWRISRVFLMHSRWWSHGHHQSTYETGCPSEIIEDIYKKDVIGLRKENTERPSSSYYYLSGPDYTEKYIIENPNTPLDIVVMVSAASPSHPNRKRAMEIMAKRS